MEKNESEIPFALSKIITLLQAVCFAGFAIGGLEFGVNVETAILFIFGFGTIALIWFVDKAKTKNPNNSSDFLHAIDIKFADYCFWLGAYFVGAIIFLSFSKPIKEFIAQNVVSYPISPKFFATMAAGMLIFPTQYLGELILEFFTPKPDIENDEFYQMKQLEIAKKSLANIFFVIFFILFGCALKFLWFGNEDLRLGILTAAAFALLIFGLAIAIAKFQISKKYR